MEYSWFLEKDPPRWHFLSGSASCLLVPVPHWLPSLCWVLMLVFSSCWWKLVITRHPSSVTSEAQVFCHTFLIEVLIVYHQWIAHFVSDFKIQNFKARSSPYIIFSPFPEVSRDGGYHSTVWFNTLYIHEHYVLVFWEHFRLKNWSRTVSVCNKLFYSTLFLRFSQVDLIHSF